LSNHQRWGHRPSKSRKNIHSNRNTNGLFLQLTNLFPTSTLLRKMLKKWPLAWTISRFCWGSLQLGELLKRERLCFNLQRVLDYSDQLKSTI
jgi:hypothetical protein